MADEKRLSEKQRRFVQEWMLDRNGTRAAIRAGYKDSSAAATASRLMKDPQVQAYRDRLIEEEFRELGINQHSLAREVWRLYQRSMEGSPHLTWDSDARAYVPDGTWRFDANGAAKALALLQKMMPRLEAGGDATDKTPAPAGIEELLGGLADMSGLYGLD